MVPEVLPRRRGRHRACRGSRFGGPRQAMPPSFDWDKVEGMMLGLAIGDSHPMQVPFIFDISRLAHRFELARFLRQHLASYYVLTLDRGELKPISRQTMFLDFELRQKMAHLLAVVMEEIEK